MKLNSFFDLKPEMFFPFKEAVSAKLGYWVEDLTSFVEGWSDCVTGGLSSLRSQHFDGMSYQDGYRAAEAFIEC